MIYLTGDTHGEFHRFNTAGFPAQRQLTKADRVIICGDFGGIWDPTASDEERYWLDWLQEKPFTLLFVDGNHENYDRLNSGEFEIIDYCGGKARKIRDGIYQLLRGQVYEMEGRRFFTFGGATSHDMPDGVLDPGEFRTWDSFMAEFRRWESEGRRFRVRSVSWWPEELPDAPELAEGLRALEAVDFQVDYVVTHCLPHDIASVLSGGEYAPDALTLYFNALLHRGLRFTRWYCGHYHTDRNVLDKYRVLYKDIIPLGDSSKKDSSLRSE